MIEVRKGMYVYAVTHTVTGRTYVGSSGKVEMRVRSHIFALRRHNHPNAEMQKDYDQYGEHYTFCILDMIPSPEFRYREREWMFRLHTDMPEFGYNTDDWIVRNRIDKNCQPIIRFDDI